MTRVADTEPPLITVALPAAAPELQTLVLRERIEALYRPRIESVASGLVVGAVLGVALLRVYPWAVVLAWYVGVFLVQFGRGALLKLSRFVPVPIHDPQRAARRYVLDVAAAGLYWGVSLALLVRTDDLLTQCFMAWAIGGMAVGSIAVHAYHPPVMYTFLACLLLPFSVRLMWVNDFSHLYLGLGMLLLGLYLALYGRFHAKVLRKSIVLRHENRQLIAQLEQERASAVRLQTQSEAASQSKSRFFAGASHDLRQPLQALSLYASVLQDSTLPDNLHQVSLRVGESVHLLEELFEGVLDIARIEAGGMELKREPVQVSQLMARTLQIFSGEALDKGLSLKSVPCALWVLGDRIALQRIVFNLVANAVRHTQSGRVLMGARRRGTLLRLSIFDTGPGIAVAAQARIFEAFYRPPSASGHGFGLGLASVRALCDAAGYTLGFQSEPGRGSQFWVELPQTAAPAAEHFDTQPSPFDTFNPVEQGLTILLVEDDAGARAALETTLRGWGHFCVSADSYPTALACLCASLRGWDAIITDFDLPDGKTGLELIAIVRTVTRVDLPAVLISGGMNDDLRADAEDARCIALAKPVRPLQLRAVLAQIGRK